MTTQEQLDALDEAIASGAKKVKYQDKEVEYHSIDDMLRARNILIGNLNTSGPISLKTTAPVYDGGFLA